MTIFAVVLRHLLLLFVTPEKMAANSALPLEAVHGDFYMFLILHSSTFVLCFAYSSLPHFALTWQHS